MEGELVPVKLEWHDDRGWTDQESANSDRQRRTWTIEAGLVYSRVQTIGNMTKIFPQAILHQHPTPESNSIEFQSVAGRDPVSGFPSIFYYKIS